MKFLKKNIKKNLHNEKKALTSPNNYKHTHKMKNALHSTNQVKQDFINLAVKQTKKLDKQGKTPQQILLLIAHTGSSFEYVLGKAWVKAIITQTIAK